MKVDQIMGGRPSSPICSTACMVRKLIWSVRRLAENCDKLRENCEELRVNCEIASRDKSRVIETEGFEPISLIAT